MEKVPGLPRLGSSARTKKSRHALIIGAPAARTTTINRVHAASPYDPASALHGRVAPWNHRGKPSLPQVHQYDVYVSVDCDDDDDGVPRRGVGRTGR